MAYFFRVTKPCPRHRQRELSAAVGLLAYANARYAEAYSGPGFSERDAQRAEVEELAEREGHSASGCEVQHLVGRSILQRHFHVCKTPNVILLSVIAKGNPQKAGIAVRVFPSTIFNGCPVYFASRSVVSAAILELVPVATCVGREPP